MHADDIEKQDDCSDDGRCKAISPVLWRTHLLTGTRTRVLRWHQIQGRIHDSRIEVWQSSYNRSSCLQSLIWSHVVDICMANFHFKRGIYSHLYLLKVQCPAICRYFDLLIRKDAHTSSPIMVQLWFLLFCLLDSLFTIIFPFGFWGWTSLSLQLS